MTATPYDTFAYPSALFKQTHPERLGVLARVFGLSSAEPGVARVLEIGGGDGLSLTAFCAAHPRAEGHNFDLSRAAIERGRQMAQAGGVSNVTMTVEDILKAHKRYGPRSFDYVIAHGVYAWVPEPVRIALMAFLDHVLADEGVAFVSFNAMPGGYIRLILRDMLLHVLAGVDEPRQRLADARAFLAGFAEPLDTDEPLQTALRHHAREMLKRPDGGLFHDELGECFFPQRMADVCAAAEAHGLRFLTDAGRNRHIDGFLRVDVSGEGDPEQRIVREVQLEDYGAVRFFRQPLFVRSERTPLREARSETLDGLRVSSAMTVRADGALVHGADTITVADDALRGRLSALSRNAPQRAPIDEIARTPLERSAVLQLVNQWHLSLHLEPEPFVLEPGEQPMTGALIRAQIAAGDEIVTTLNHELVEIGQEAVRALLTAADGSRTIAQIAEAVTGHIPAEHVQPALRAAARKALLSA